MDNKRKQEKQREIDLIQSIGIALALYSLANIKGGITSKETKEIKTEKETETIYSSIAPQTTPSEVRETTEIKEFQTEKSTTNIIKEIQEKIGSGDFIYKTLLFDVAKYLKNIQTSLDKLVEFLKPVIANINMVYYSQDGGPKPVYIPNKYNADIMVVSDQYWKTVWGGSNSRNMTFASKAGRWEIRILTKADYMEGKEIQNEDVIRLYEGDSIGLDIDAVRVEARCIDATSSFNGILLWCITYK